MMTARTRHLVGVWNPSYEADAMDEHLAILLTAVREFRDGKRDEDDVYVWWGKVKSSNRQQPLPHLADILALEQTLSADDPPETHLYLTDYRSLYVTHLAAVTGDDRSEERGHVPEYYSRKRLSCDCWFQLWDIRRLVLDDTPAVTRELAKLRNVRYNDRPVSIYGGMVELPLIVTRDDDSRFFDETVREALTGGKHWVEFDAERTGAGEIQRELRENRFGNDAWSNLQPAACLFIATAEQLYRSHRADAGFDFSNVLVDLAKAVEVQVNAVLRRAMAGAPPGVRSVNLEGTTVDLARADPLSLGQLARVIGENREVNQLLRKRLAGGEWFAVSLPAILGMLAEVRNRAAHGGQVDRDEVGRLRDRLVGVGCKGELLELAQVRAKRIAEAR